MADNDAPIDAKESVIDYDFSEEAEHTPVEETTTEESSPEETKAPVVESNETEDETEPAKEEADTSDETEDDKPKAKNSAENRIRSLVSEKRELQRQVEQLTAQAYPAATAEQLQEQGMDSTEAQFEAMRQKDAVKDYTQRVVELTNDLNMESMQVMMDMPLFNPSSEAYDKDFAQEVAEMYSDISGIQTDPNTGQIIQARVLPYDFYKRMANTYSRGTQKGQIAGKQAAVKQLSSVDTTGNPSTKKAEVDPVMAVLLKGLDD